MDLADRAMMLVIGGLIGFVFGYIVARLRVIKDELDEVKEELDEVVETTHDHPRPEETRGRSERGSMKRPTVPGVALLIVVLLTAWAAFTSQRATHETQETQEQVVKLAVCNQEFLGKTILALNERTTYSGDATEANVDLQKSQAAFFAVYLGPPPSTAAARREAASDYLKDLTAFISISEKSKLKVENNPYPTNVELAECLSK